MINQYLESPDNKKIGYVESENSYYYEKITGELQYYSVTWRGKSKQIINNNRLLKLLSDNGIRYKASAFLSKSPEDCPLPCYYTRIQFWTDRNYFHDKSNHKIISWSELEEILAEIKNVNGSYI